MELQQIQYFLTLAQELHFWNSAEKLFITQSALSRQIKALEEELGIQLFERTKRTVKLTEAGIFLRDQWLRMMDDIDRIHRQAKSINEGVYGTIRIGYPGSISFGFLPEIISNLSTTLPDVRIELIEPTDISFEQLLLNYNMDIAFRRDPAENPALQSICLYAEHFSLAVPHNHHLTQKNFKGLQDVKNERFILSGLHHKTLYVSSLRQIFSDYNFTPDVYIESDYGSIILGLVAKGVGISVLPGSYAFSAPPDVRFIPLPHSTNLYVTWRKDDHSRLLQNVLLLVQEQAKVFSKKQL
ncbi:LysR family transcriptional regulator [Flavisolibacter tropicus]|uniref:LysR family transcriptional regulator n=1 Tax=Flavisolibacter tropicus TaxID=1492898 RepID=A0A172TST8_9BACT|nr:LysR family transcriptional regulator [Flavisolibacter tropicus]ANE50100.1 LysR family transcriptional regulator [Flavisolibacter tropicus]